MRGRIGAVLLLAVGVTLVASGAALGQQYSLTSADTVEVATGETVSITLLVADLPDSAQAYNWWITVDPASAFDLTTASFADAPTGWTFFPPEVEGSVVKPGALALMPGTAQIIGTASLGTVTLSFAGDANTEATVTVDSVLVGSFDDVLGGGATALGYVTVVNPPAPPVPPPTVASVSPATGSVSGGKAMTIVGSNFVEGATVTVGGNAAADVVFVSADTLTATIPAGAVGAADVVVTNPDEQFGTLAGGFTYLAVVDPTLTAVGATDQSVAYSDIGQGAEADGSRGEVTFTVRFTDATGGVAAGQTVAFAITNVGGQAVYVLGEAVTEIGSGEGPVSVEVATNAQGLAAVVIDAEAERDAAATTSVTVTATTTAANSEGTDMDLTAGPFTASWDVARVAELASFLGAVVPGDVVLLEWTVASQTNNLGWEVYRSTDNETFEQVGGLVAGDGTSDVLKSYSYTDADLPAADVLYYYLNQVDLDGTTSASAVIEVALNASVIGQVLPTANALWQNFPNPFNPETTISFDLAAPAAVSLVIYDVNGQVVRTLLDGQSFAAGHYSSLWNGLDQRGVKVASGVYFYVLQTSGSSFTKRMLLLQ